MYRVHGPAASNPGENRLMESICKMLLERYKRAINRPRGSNGCRLTISKCIVQLYNHIQDLVGATNLAEKLVLLPINQATVSAW